MLTVLLANIRCARPRDAGAVIRLMQLLALACVLAAVQSAAVNWRPVVLMHGAQAGAEAMSHSAAWIAQDFPGIYIKNVEIGNGKQDSMQMPINEQVENFAKQIQNDTRLRYGFNCIGHSQGGLITRAYVERYNNPPVYNLLSWAGPQDGVYGVPDFNAWCPDKDCPWLNHMFDILLTTGASKYLQKIFTPATYWKDVLDYKGYLRDNEFLADINNERDTKNATYRANMLKLNSYLLEYSTNDTIVIPKESPWFSFYTVGQDRKVQPWNESPTFMGDWIGLKTLQSRNAVIRVTTPCTHENIPRDVCKFSYVAYSQQLLNNTLPAGKWA